MVAALTIIICLLATFKIWAPSGVDENLPKINKYLYLAGLLVLIGWGCIYLPPAFSKGYMPDEGWFLKIAVSSFIENGISIGNTIFHKNNLGYGGIWWGVYVFVIWMASLIWPISDLTLINNASEADYRISLFDVIDKSEAIFNSIIIMKALSISLFIIFALRLLNRSLIKPENIFGFLILLSTPMIYWSGKIASPELIGVYTLLISILCYIDSKKNHWLIVSGFSVGLKLTIAPVCAAFFLYVLYEKRKDVSFREVTFIGFLFFIGLLLANLYAIINPIKFIDPIVNVSTAFSSSPIGRYIYTNPVMFWEGGTYGNLYYWFGSGISFFALMVISFRVNIRLGLMLLCSFILMLIFISTQPAHNWYWFPVIGLISIPFARMANLDGKTRTTIVILTSIFLIINVIESHRWIKKEIFYLNVKESSASGISEINACLRDASSALDVEKFYDMVSIGYASHINAKLGRVDYIDSYLLINTPNYTLNKKSFVAFGERAKQIISVNELINRSNVNGSKVGECGTVTWIYAK
ncbi:Uncharacterised protein [Yersinia massiliensis]|uniref:glycosyltransferase family 39 protein n=1 Tax=Yersinia massiliensis TaxID=419257 RepID=UPI0005E411FD|nr:glycosyltransferase family 39 protein [Yersinia massiliensis]CNI61346.1 Uncharacterised protein [Yersinia massiliensis]